MDIYTWLLWSKWDTSQKGNLPPNVQIIEIFWSLMKQILLKDYILRN